MAEKKQKILVIDDERQMRELLSLLLEKSGYSVVPAENANDAFEEIKRTKFNLILLDLVLPDIHGIKFCEFIKREKAAKDIPVIIITSEDKMPAKIAGLETGADDYITKPFNNHELLARIKAVLRRQSAATIAGAPRESALRAGKLVLDREAHTVFNGKAQLRLNHKEYELLVFLMENMGKLLSRGIIYENVWGEEYLGDTRTVDVHISFLRRKLKNSGCEILTLDRAGYKLVS